MKVTEFKVRTINKLFNIIDGWFDNGFQDGMINGVLKTIIKANQNKFDELLKVFTDEQGNIDLSEINKQMEKVVPENLEIDLKDYANKMGVPPYLVPNKILILPKQDVISLFK
jgi:hypothetical protein